MLASVKVVVLTAALFDPLLISTHDSRATWELSTNKKLNLGMTAALLFYTAAMPLVSSGLGGVGAGAAIRASQAVPPRSRTDES